MKITSKGRHAVRIMVDIARNKDEYVSISDISNRQHITTKYLEQIIALLVKGKLVESMRGVKGGYKLTRSPESITVKEILDATGDTTKIAGCLNGEKCPMAEKCDTMGVWNELTNLINDYLNKITLQNLMERIRKK